MADKPKLRRFFRPRFTLGALLLLVTAICPPLAFIAQRRAWNKDRAAAYEILNSRASISLHKGPAKTQWKWVSAWRNKLLGKETAQLARIQFIGGSSNTSWGVRTQDVTDDAIRRLRYFPELEEVNIFVSPDLTDEGLGALGQLPNLKALQISSCPKVKGSFFTKMKAHRKFTHLSLSNMESLEGEYLVALQRFYSLHYLKIFNCKSLTDASLRNVSLPSTVKRVTVAQLKIGDEPIARWFNETKLLALTLDTNITRAIAPALSTQTELESLCILNAPLEDRDLEFLGKCKKLDHLVLNGMPTQGAFLREIQARPPLGYVNLCSTPLTDENAAELWRFEKLHTLDLKFTSVTGEFLFPASFGPVSLGRSVRSINLVGTELSDAGKDALAKLSESKSIDLPLNWKTDDFERYAALGKSNSQSVSRAGYQAFEVIDPIGRCPPEMMAPVIRLHDLARALDKKTHTAKGGR